MKQLDPKAVWLFFISFISRWIIPIVILSFWTSEFFFGMRYTDVPGAEVSFPFLNWLWLTIPAFFVLCFVWAKLTYRFYGYELTENGFRKESGVIYKKYITIPYDRIQNVDIYRGIWARILGLSDLQIQTAGSSAVVTRNGAYGVGAEGRLPGLTKEVAEQLRDELIIRAKKSKNQGL